MVKVGGSNPPWSTHKQTKRSIVNNTEGILQVVSSADNATYAEITLFIDDLSFMACGISKRSPQDFEDKRVGELYANARAFKRLAKQLEKAANVLDNENARIAAEARRKLNPPVKGGTLHPGRLAEELEAQRAAKPRKKVAKRTIKKAAAKV
jgi:hypothetical protein